MPPSIEPFPIFCWRKGVILVLITLVLTSPSRLELGEYMPNIHHGEEDSVNSYLSSSPKHLNPNTLKQQNFFLNQSSKILIRMNEAEDIFLKENREVLHKFLSNTNSTIVPCESPMPLQSFNLSIVVQLSGELGNHLSKVAFAYAIQQLLLERYRISSHFVLQHHKHLKWKRAQNDLQQCFPFFRDYDFELGNSPEFQQQHLLQRKYFQRSKSEDAFVFPLSTTLPEVDAKLEEIAQILTNMSENAKMATTGNKLSNVIDEKVLESKNGNITFPFIYVQDFAGFPLIDRYYNQLRNLFRFDHTACCAELPYDDEAIFHFRNYLGEMPRKGKQKGFEELSPNRTAYELFSHLRPGDKIAMTSRILGHPTTQMYANAFRERGLQLRIISNQTGVQDYCFLQSAQRDLAGVARSTYLQWAAILGDNGERSRNGRNKRRSWLYSIDSNDTRNALRDEATIQYNWTYNPILISKIRFIKYSVG